MFYRLSPWQNRRQRDLTRACFHRDQNRAKALAKRWQATYDLDAVLYDEHRLLLRLLARFPKGVFPAAETKRINGLRRQSWVRGNLNLDVAVPALSVLDTLDIPWVFTGEAQWFARPDFAHREGADVIEITVPDAARSATTLALKQNGWAPGWATPDDAEGQVYSLFSKGNTMIRMLKSGALFGGNSDLMHDLLQNRIATEHPLGQLYFPDRRSSIAIAIAKTHRGFNPDNCWIFDLFNISDTPIESVEQANASIKQQRRITQFLTRNFQS